MRGIYIHIILLLLGAIILSSCKKCGNKIGELTEHKATVETYRSLKVNGKFTIKICQDTSYSLKIKAGEGLIPNINYKVVDGVLEIENKNTCSFTHNYSDGVVLQLGVGPLESMWFSNPESLSISGSLTSDHLNVHLEECAQNTQLNGNFKSLALRMEGGSSNVRLSGTTDSLGIFSNSFGHLESENFIAKKVHIDINSTGDMTVAPVSELKVKLKGSGSVYYSGNPTLEVTYAEGSSGKVKAI